MPCMMQFLRLTFVRLLDIAQGILHYDLIRKESSNPFLYPPILTFFMYENFF